MDWMFSVNCLFLWHFELIFLPSLVLYSLYFYSTWLYVIRKVKVQQNMFSPTTISAPVPSQEALAYVSPVYVRVLAYIWFILCTLGQIYLRPEKSSQEVVNGDNVTGRWSNRQTSTESATLEVQQELTSRYD
jgi:hypothetical protein